MSGPPSLPRYAASDARTEPYTARLAVNALWVLSRPMHLSSDAVLGLLARARLQAAALPPASPPTSRSGGVSLMCSGDCTSRSSPNRIVLAAGSLSSLTSVLTLSLGFAWDLFLSPPGGIFHRLCRDGK